MVYINVSMPSISPSDLTFITSILHDILVGNIRFWPLSIVYIQHKGIISLLCGNS